MSALAFYFPTVLWGLGLLEFVATALRGPAQRTQGWSLALACALLGVAVFARRDRVQAGVRALVAEWRTAPFVFQVLSLVALAILALAGWEARLPPRLPQEFDALNYHMSIPRQHLLLGSLAHIAWSAADLMPMPLQWGMASWWFSGELLHKLPQFVFSLWIVILMIKLGRETGGRGYRGWLPALALVGSHGVMIQLGTAMMDLPILYAAVAAWDAARSGRRGWFALHAALFATAKAFSPLQAACLAGVAALSLLPMAGTERRAWLKRWLPAAAAAGALSLLLLGRSAWVSLERAGTPLFPFAVCSLEPLGIHPDGCLGREGEVVRASAREHMGTRDAYGEGRGARALVTHLWKVSVPSQGVNNAYDYPLGLPWLLLVVFCAAAAAGFRKARPDPALLLAAAFWLLWWMSSHQSRWLYPTLAFGWLGTLGIQRKASPRVICGALLVSASLSLFSQWRALRADFGLDPLALQRRQEERAASVPETLYVKHGLKTHAPGAPIWILSVD